MKAGVSFFKMLFEGSGTPRFVVGVVLSFALSISVILCTFGLMDGFEHTLKRALKLSSGDISLFSRRGFFTLGQEERNLFEEREVDYAPFIQTEGFVVRDHFSKGVIVKGIESESFSKVSGLAISLKGNEMAVGRELARTAGLAQGDELALALATGKRQWSTLPTLSGFRIAQIIDHGIYDKNMRFVYVALPKIQEMLGAKALVNLVALNRFSPEEKDLTSKVSILREDLAEHLDSSMVLRPFWQEFAPLLEAVEVEKLAIAVILQLVIVIAIFNIVAFVTFLSEQKARELFLFQALGVSRQRMVWGWMMLLTVIWAASCLLATAFSKVFEWALLNIGFLELPGKIYSLGRIQLELSPLSYVTAFLLALLWLMGIAWFGLKGLQKESLLSRLRLGFHS
ncbi:MAG: hypothetical protein OXB88_04515 [Bacteriovoracales bacterium]|nr:hypothetical protein [Bacteriovoracales bacterium]